MIDKPSVHRCMQRLGLRSREEFIQFSQENVEEFSAAMLDEARVHWLRPYGKVLDTSDGVEWARWSTGGKLNIADNCLDRYRDSSTSRFFRRAKTGRRARSRLPSLHRDQSAGQRVARNGTSRGRPGWHVHADGPEIVTICTACFKLGLIVVPIFADSARARLPTRRKIQARDCVFTSIISSGAGRQSRSEPRWSNRRESSVHRENRFSRSIGRTYCVGKPAECETLALDSEARALILYTSNHRQSPRHRPHARRRVGEMSKEIYLAFDHKLEDRFFWLSDIGWMMGPWTIIGNHHFGGPSLVLTASRYPDPGRLWRIIERHGITTFGISPTAIRLLMRDDSAQRHAMPSLRLLGNRRSPG